MLNWIRSALKSIWFFLLSAVLGGIIGNRADTGFMQALPYIGKPITLPLWIFIALVVLTAAPFAITSLRFRKAHQIAVKLNELDDTFLLLLSKLDVNPDLEEGIALLIDQFLEETLELFVDGCRISVLRPDRNDPDFLTIWRSLRIPVETVKRTRFYIGTNNFNNQRGIAGYTFSDCKLRVVRLLSTNGEWIADSSEYKVFVKHKYPPYKVFAAVPIVSNPGKCIGVLCIDSMVQAAFDSEKVNHLLLAVAHRLATAMSVTQMVARALSS